MSKKFTSSSTSKFLSRALQSAFSSSTNSGFDSRSSSSPQDASKTDMSATRTSAAMARVCLTSCLPARFDQNGETLFLPVSAVAYRTEYVEPAGSPRRYDGGDDAQRQHDGGDDDELDHR